jgi:flagellar basal-body rod protein FlgC
VNKLSSSLSNIFDVSARAMSAQMMRLNTVASNLANARSTYTNPEDAYRAIKPVFSTVYADKAARTGIASVDVESFVRVEREPLAEYRPDDPKANDEGYVYAAAVDTDEEMVEMLDASRNYQNNIEVVTTLKALMMRTINLGK